MDGIHLAEAMATSNAVLSHANNHVRSHAKSHAATAIACIANMYHSITTKHTVKWFHSIVKENAVVK